jgi:hypothetical protein
MRTEIADQQDETAVSHRIESEVDKKVRFDESENKMSCRQERIAKKNVDSLKLGSSLLESQRNLLKTVLLKHHDVFAWDQVQVLHRDGGRRYVGLYFSAQLTCTQLFGK